ITQANCTTIADVTRQLVTELGDRFAKPRVIPRLRILGLYPPEIPQPVRLVMLIQLLRLDGYAANTPSAEDTSMPISELVARYGPDLVIAAWSNRAEIAQLTEPLGTLIQERRRLPAIGLGECDDDERLKLY